MAFPALARERARASTRSAACTSSGPTGANAYVDITATVDRKLDALRCHASQIKDFAEVEKWIGEWSAIQGKEIGVANADGFYHVVIDDDEETADRGAEATRREAAEAGVAGLGAGPAVAPIGLLLRGATGGRPPRRATGRRARAACSPSSACMSSAL